MAIIENITVATVYLLLRMGFIIKKSSIDPRTSKKKKIWLQFKYGDSKIAIGTLTSIFFHGYSIDSTALGILIGNPRLNLS